MMDSNAIETLSVNAVRDSIVVSDFLNQFISDNDKEPSWDGFVYIYDDKSKKKEKLQGRLPVQIKGTEKNDLSKQEITFPVSTVDLKNYLYDGGIVFFVVYIAKNGSQNQIYYATLTPVKLKIYLSEAKGQKSKTIKLKKFPCNSNKKATIFFQCLEDCRRQASFSSAKLLSIEELAKQGVLDGLSIPISVVGDIEPKMALLTNEVYLYANVKGSPIPQPVGIIPQKMIVQEEKNATIEIDNRLYYTKVSIIQDEKTVTTKIGESFSMIAKRDNKSVQIKYKNSNKIRTMVKDLDFMLSYIEFGSFKYDGVDFPFLKENANFSNFSMEEEKEHLNFAKKIVQAFNILGCNKDLDLKNLKETDWKNINTLVTAFVDKKPVTNLANDIPPIIGISVGEARFILYAKKIDKAEGTYRIYDFFKTDVPLTFDNGKNGKIPISQYAILHVDDFLTADNIRFDVFLPSFEKFKQYPEAIEQMVLFMLNLIRAYDIDCSRNEILNTAKQISEWFNTLPDKFLPYEIKLLNTLQIKKRIQPLSITETRELIKIVETPSMREDVLVGAYLLLEQQVAAQIHFEKMDTYLQNDFKEYPIYHFWNKSEVIDNGQAENALGE